MEKIMLVTIGVGSGFTVCGCLMFYVMAKIASGNTSSKAYSERTIELMEERNRLDAQNGQHLESIAGCLERKLK